MEIAQRSTGRNATVDSLCVRFPYVSAQDRAFDDDGSTDAWSDSLGDAIRAREVWRRMSPVQRCIWRVHVEQAPSAVDIDELSTSLGLPRGRQDIIGALWLRADTSGDRARVGAPVRRNIAGEGRTLRGPPDRRSLDWTKAVGTD